MTEAPKTLIDRRKQKTIDDLIARQKRAKDYIANQHAKLEEKLAPHRNELDITEKALALYGVLPDGSEGVDGSTADERPGAQ